MKELQQKDGDSKKAHKLEIMKINNTLSSNTEEAFWLRNHNKILVTKIKNLKSILKLERVNEDFEGKIFEKQEENNCLRNLNQELDEQIKKLKDNEQSQEEKFKNISYVNKLLENKLEQIQTESSKLSRKQI